MSFRQKNKLKVALDCSVLLYYLCFQDDSRPLYQIGITVKYSLNPDGNYSCGQKFTSTLTKEHVRYIMAVLSPNGFYSSHFSVVE